jgi:hypothetical protein
MGQAAAMTLRVSDVSGQKTAKASSVPITLTIGELVDGLLAKMGLARVDAQGRPLHYYARLEREGRHLNGAETVGALREGDELTLTPNIDAGGR